MALNRDQGSCYTIHIGINDLHFRTSTPSRPTCNAYAKASRSQRAQYPIRRHRVRDVTGCQSSGPCGITASNLRDDKACWHRANGPRAYQLRSCHGPAGGAPAAGVGGGVSTERIPRGKPPHLARRGEIATKTQELRPALSVNTQPNAPCMWSRWRRPLRSYLRRV